MLFSEFRMQRMNALFAEPWGNIRIPDLLEVFSVATPHRVLETGSYRGVSTEFWALTCRRVVSIDPSPDMAVRRDLLARLSHYPNVELVQKKSPWIPDRWDFDLVYLDGDHSAHHVAREIESYLPMLRRAGGWIGGHDYTDTPTLGDGVKEAVDDFFGVPEHRFSDGSWLVKVEKE